MSSTRLGDHLVQRGLITETQLAVALQQQERTGERLGRLLLILGSIRRLDLGRALAELWQLPFITITPDGVSPAVAQRFPLEATLKFRAVPIRDDGVTLTVAVADPPSADLRETLAVVYPGRTLDVRVTT